MNTKYLSTQGRCLCEKHVRHGGAYLTCEVEKPKQTVSNRCTIDGIEAIITPLDTWLILDTVEDTNGIECEVCEDESEREN